MNPPVKIIHCLNQFFGGLGEEEQAHLAPEVHEGARGPGLLLEKLCPDLKITATIIFGDNYFAEHTAEAEEKVLALLEPCFDAPRAERPELLLAGPAFNAGRYGIACGAICRAVHKRFGITAVTGMFPENPAVDEYRRDVFIAPVGGDAMDMRDGLLKMAALGEKLLRQEDISAERQDYISHGRRRNFFADKTGAARALDMLLRKVKDETFDSEYAMPVFDRVEPAPALSDLSSAKLALVTSGGIVPHGNPDKIESAHAHRFGAYSLRGLTTLSPDTHQTVHGGYDPTWASQNPNRVLPLDAVLELHKAGFFGTLHEYYYTTVGNATPVANAAEFGRDIGRRLTEAGVQAVILTST